MFKSWRFLDWAGVVFAIAVVLWVVLPTPWEERKVLRPSEGGPPVAYAEAMESHSAFGGNSRLSRASTADTLPGMSTTLSWQLPSGATQYQLRVTPSTGDGPGINVIRSVENSFFIPPPPTWYGLLPDMTYTWRIRFSGVTGAIGETDSSWGGWSGENSFRTPIRNSSRITPISPVNGTMVGREPLVLRWDNSDKDVFYYEVQVSPDAQFGAQGAVSYVWHNLVHGGVSAPINSWLTPQLYPGVTYYWRVRPRAQGDGTPVAWSTAFSFQTSGSPVQPQPTPTPTPVPSYWVNACTSESRVPSRGAHVFVQSWFLDGSVGVPGSTMWVEVKDGNSYRSARQSDANGWNIVSFQFPGDGSNEFLRFLYASLRVVIHYQGRAYYRDVRFEPGTQC